MPTICPKTKKQVHPSIEKAKAHLKDLKEKKDYEGHVYPCLFCKGYHVGREKANAHKNKYKKDF